MATPSPPHAGASAATAAEKKTHKEQPRIRRRNRLITSCLECRRRKLKCDKQNPCVNCTRFNRDCLFITPALDPEGQAKLAEVKEKMGMLERTLEEDVARRGSNKSPLGPGLFETPTLPGLHDESPSDQEDDDETKDLVSHPLATEDAAYYEDEGNDDIIDLGIQMGKIRVTERIGGFVRPRFSEELAQALKEIPKRQLDINPFAEQSPETWMAPSREYVAPSSSFLFAPGVHRSTLMTYLPSKILVDKLIEHYWRAVHVVARILHRPSFERLYERFWNDINSGIEPRNSFQAVVFAALLSSVISMSEEKVLTEFGVAKDGLVENFKQASEAALSRANFLRTTRLETLQAFVMYMIPLCRAEVSRAHSALAGMCIRLAECMSLHRDPSHYTSDPVEIQIRRLIWYQICFLDLRTCEATGPRPQIRREEYDTRFPLNVDDVDLEGHSPVTEDRKHFTDMTITRMRFECGEMQRILWSERARLDAKKTTLTSILSKIQKFSKAMEKTYLPLFQKTHPLHVVAMEIYGILSCRLYCMVLQKFLSSHDRLMPDRLRQLVMSCSVMILEHSMTLEQTPALADWSWYVGALHQYHTALLLLSELYAVPRNDPVLEARVWRGLDHVFELPAGLESTEKIRMVLEELIGRTETYAVMRRLRAPAKMDHAKPRHQSPEYQRRQSEQEEHERRGSSVQSGISGPTLSSGSSPQSSSYQYQHQQQQQMNQMSQMGSLGYMAATSQMDHFGAPLGMAAGVDMQAGATHMLPGQSPEMPHFNVAPASPPGANSLGGSSDTSSSFNFNNPPGAPGSGASPMDSMPEIDWNEWDQLFGTAEMQASILIPPYTFPQFDTNNLQWPGDGLQ
ncbi:hypothetical protein K491DRAFT_711554 [Lophiostoma macrostomum CBS 122681]|uniref:Zn(2)-C6 fungal-type domain-containing protein n=1 Tax=Lophiostoma macrostomum CBS 122681 TaxID=1314788 RepID=A0A6A6TMV7_9PLEO|nr:hypothetical protein K491DRAFT_711554 [Lophiostoma macrostomum CBS 122681]